jgi:hypothetical protein
MLNAANVINTNAAHGKSNGRATVIPTKTAVSQKLPSAVAGSNDP